MKISCLYVAVCAYFILSLVSMPAQAELIERNGGLIYDTVLDITWGQPDITAVTWDDANAWAAGLTLGGVSGWRLAYTSVAAGAGPSTDNPVLCESATEPECQDNELGYMFYHNLGGTNGEDILGSGDPDLALFPNLRSDISNWSGTAYDPDDAWYFTFAQGQSNAGSHSFLYLAWPVHEGDVGTVPNDEESWSTIKAMYK